MANPVDYAISHARLTLATLLLLPPVQRRIDSSAPPREED